VLISLAEKVSDHFSFLLLALPVRYVVVDGLPQFLVDSLLCGSLSVCGRSIIREGGNIE
jgi:hypothetical protein